MTFFFLFLAGLLVGGFFYGGLLLTVRLLPQMGAPYRMLFGSFLIRSLLTLSAFYLLMAGSWARLAALLLGFTTARLLIVRRVMGHVS